MTRYGLRARVITLTLAPTLIIGLLLSAFFSFNRYHDLKKVMTSGLNIIEPLAIASEEGLKSNSRESVRCIISYAHRKNSKLCEASPYLITTTSFCNLKLSPKFWGINLTEKQTYSIGHRSELRDNTLILRRLSSLKQVLLPPSKAKPLTPLWGTLLSN